MWRHSIITRLINELAVRLHRSDAMKSDDSVPIQRRTSSGRFEPKPFDVNRARELRRSGLSVRMIAREMNVPKSTVFDALKHAEPAPVPEKTPQEAAGQTQPKPEPSPFDSVELSKPSPAAVAAPAIPPSVRVEIAVLPPALAAPEPFWWDRLPSDRRAHLMLTADAYSHVFLTDDTYAAERCWGYGQPCIAIDAWYDSYAHHPAFAGVERFWVHTTSGKLIRSLQNSAIRSRCWILPIDVVDAAQWKRDLRMQRQETFFEACLNCRQPGLRPIPEPPAPIDDLIAPPEPKPELMADFSYQPSWMLGGSTASR